MKAIVKLVLLTALRDRLFASLAILIVADILVSLFLGDAALIEKGEAGRVFAAGSCRALVVLGVSIFAAFQIRRMFESREIEAILSRSISRFQFVVALGSSFAAVNLVLVVPLGLVFFALYGVSGASCLWLVSLWLEATVVLSFVIFAAITFESATTTILATAAFYVCARLMGFFLGIKDANSGGGWSPNTFINPLLDALALVIPRIDLWTQSDWLVYGFDAPGLIAAALAQGIVFIVLVLGAAMIDLSRKQF